MNCADELTSIDLSQNPHTSSKSTLGGSSQTSLYPFISLPHCFGLNLEKPTIERVLRPLDTKDVVKSNEEVESEVPEEELAVLLSSSRNGGGVGGKVWTGGCVDSQDGDDEMILHIQFTSLVRITTLLLGTSGGHLPTSPRLTKIWVNRPNGISFDEVAEGATKPDGEFELLESPEGGRGATEYPVRVTRFGNVKDLDIYFANPSRPLTTLYYLGFLGESREIKKDENEGMMVGAENGVSGMVDGVREQKGSGSLVK